MDLAAELWWRGETVWFCEQDKYASSVLARHWPGAPVYKDVRTLVEDGACPVDVLCGGPPCVDLSCAGAQKGLHAERSGLFFDFVAAAAALKPKWVFIENVPALLSKWRGTVEDALESAGYASIVWAKVAAQHCGAPHKRARVFVLASREGRMRGVCDAGPLPPVGRWPTPTSAGQRQGAGAGQRRMAGIEGGEVSLSNAVHPSAWPTPRATEHKAMAWSTPTVGFDGDNGVVALARKGRVSAILLGQQVSLAGWATPAASDDRDRGDIMNTPAVQRRDAIGKQLGLSMQAGGKLSPLWVETVQGLPVGWTDTEGESMRDEAMATAHAPQWPAPMVKGMWGDSPQHDHEPPRVVVGKLANRSARLRCLGNLNPPAQYLLALKLLHEGPRQQSLLGLC